MTRYLRILRLFWGAALAAEMEYRINFVLAALSSLANLVGSAFGLYLLFRNGYEPGGWTWRQALMVLGIFTLLQGVSAAILTPNLSRIAGHVERGTLDFVLLMPVDSQFWLSTRNISPWGLPDITLGVGMILFSAYRLSLSPLNLVLGLVPVALGVLILYSMWFLLGATSIWFVKVYNVTEVLRGFMEAGRFPMSAYPAAYRFFLTFVVPVAFLTTIPAEIILGRETPYWLLAMFALTAAMLTASRLFWHFALRHYTSASS